MEHPGGDRRHAAHRARETRGRGARRVHGPPPCTRAPRSLGRPWRFDQWEIIDDLAPMSIPVVECPDDATLARLRTDFYSPPFPVHEAPTFRVQVARRPHGDLVQIIAAHAAVDGIGMLRLLRSITDAYRGKAEAPPPLPLEEARDLKKQLRSETYSEFAGRAWKAGAS